MPRQITPGGKRAVDLGGAELRHGNGHKPVAEIAVGVQVTGRNPFDPCRARTIDAAGDQSRRYIGCGGAFSEYGDAVGNAGGQASPALA